MRIRLTPFILLGLLFLLLENAVIPWLIPSAYGDRLYPHLLFILTMFSAVFGNRHQTFFYGLGFGLLQDFLSYGHLVGPYAFCYALIGYFVGLIATSQPVSFNRFMTFIFVGSFVLDSFIFAIYHLFRLTHLSYFYIIYWQIAPTAFLQLLIALFLYVPICRKMVQRKYEETSKFT